MDGDLPRRPSTTPEGQNPEGQNLENIAGSSRVPKPEIPHRPGKGPMMPEDPANQTYTKGGDDEGEYDEGYYPLTAEEEVEILRKKLAESNHVALELTRQLEEAHKAQPGRPKNKKSTRRTQTVVTDTATVQTEAQTCTGPVTCQAARAAGDTQTQAANVQVPQGPRQPPSPIRHPPSPIRHPDPEQPRNNPAPYANNS